MSEKVLGFYGKDALGWTALSTAKTLEGKTIINIPEDKLVLVVTIKWLEKLILDMAKDSEVKLHTRGDDSSKEGYMLALNNLLVSIRAEKQARVQGK